MSELKVIQIPKMTNIFGRVIGLTEYYLKSEADRYIAHQKHKRCLAMARWCRDRWADIATPYFKSLWYYKWQNRWLELAKQFNEAK